MRSRDPKLFAHAAAFILVMALLAGAHHIVNPWLRYQRAEVLDGQVWRLITCQIVHLNFWHFLLNTSGLVLILFFFRDLLDRLRFWLWFGVSSLGVGLIFLLDPALNWYLGLSDLIQSLLVLCVLLGWRGNPVLHSLLLAAVIGKLIWEHSPDYNDNYLRPWIHAPVYVNAHLYGAIMGVVLALAILIGGKISERRRERLEVES